MPTYEYECPACGVIEVVQSMRDAALTRCPQCRKRKVTKLISSGAGVIFKGDGFWETDYNRSKDYGAKQKAESAPKSDAAPAKSDAAPKSDAPAAAETPAKAPAAKPEATKATKATPTKPAAK